MKKHFLTVDLLSHGPRQLFFFKLRNHKWPEEMFGGYLAVQLPLCTWMAYYSAFPQVAMADPNMPLTNVSGPHYKSPIASVSSKNHNPWGWAS